MLVRLETGRAAPDSGPGPAGVAEIVLYGVLVPLPGDGPCAPPDTTGSMRLANTA